MSTPPDQLPPNPPQSPSTPPEDPREDAAPAISTDDRNLAMLTHLSGIVFAFLVPLVVWLLHKDRTDKDYLLAEAKEALNFQITVFIAYVICWVLTVIVIGAVLFWLVWLVNLILCIMAAVEVNKSGTYRYPFALRLVS
ncbi:MAG TPA: DUF4870 domain-containing protein [Rhodanobacteraceae bacterium]